MEATAYQLQKLIKALQEGKMSTYDIAKISASPSKRISELRQMGYPLHQEKIDHVNEDGRKVKKNMYWMNQDDVEEYHRLRGVRKLMKKMVA